MATDKFLKKEALSFGWNAFKSRVGFWIGAMVIYSAVYIIGNFVSNTEGESAGTALAVFIASVIIWLLQMWVSLGMTQISLNFTDQKPVTVGMLFTAARGIFFKYLGGMILYFLIVLGGFILLIVPGIIWGIKFQFFQYFIVDEKLGPIAALKKSAAITAGVKGDLLVFGLLVGLVNLLGVLVLIVGLFATMPTTFVAMAYVYRKLAMARAVPAPTAQVSPAVNPPVA